MGPPLHSAGVQTFPAQKPPLSFSAIEAIGVAVLVKFFDKARIDEIAWCDGFGLGIFYRKLVKNGFDPFGAWVLFRRQFFSSIELS
jgi:hypothetical protein